MDPNHAMYTFDGMLFGYIVRQPILRMSRHTTHDRNKIAKDFVTIFLRGMLKREL